MGQITFRRFEQLLQQMLVRLVARSKLTSVNDAAGAKNMLAAVARELEDIHFRMADVLDTFSLTTAVGSDLDRRGNEIVGAPTRTLLGFAVGTAIFSRPGIVGTVVINAGTLIKTEEGIEFVTTAGGAIVVGFTASTPIPIRAVRGGISGNVATGTVVKFGTKTTGVEAVSNNTATTQGRDKEKDDAFRARLIAYVKSTGRSTVDALKYAAQTAKLSTGERVVFSHVFEDPIVRGEVVVYVDDGAGTIETTAAIGAENVTFGLAGPPANSAVGGEQYLNLDHWPVREESPFSLTSSTRGLLVSGTDYHLDVASGSIYFTPALVTAETITAAYTYFTGLIAEAQKIMDGDVNDRQNYPGYRAAGVHVVVLSPDILQIAVDATIFIAPGFIAADVEAEVAFALQEFVNNLGISADIYRSELVERIMGVDGVYNCVLNVPTSDLVLLDDQLPRLIDANTTIAS